MEEIKIKPPQLVAVYGTLRRGHGNYMFLLSDQKFLGEFKSEPKYTMLSNGGFPIVFPEGDTRITLEVFEVDNQETLDRLDSLEGYPGWYNRSQIDTPWGKAWMYYMENLEDQLRTGKAVVTSGDWNEFVGMKVEEVE